MNRNRVKNVYISDNLSMHDVERKYIYIFDVDVAVYC